jgi:uncharacterized membrane protein (DUF4010 family)
MSMTSIFLIGILIVVVVYAIMITIVIVYAKDTGKDPRSTITTLIIVFVIFLIGLLYIYLNYQMNTNDVASEYFFLSS